jgi:hypothetical protein
MKPRGKTKRIGCVICGSRTKLQWHHIGGRNHMAWVEMPLCYVHHEQCHKLLKSHGVNLEYTSDPVQRLIRASIAVSIFLCIVQEALRSATLSQPNH